MTVYVGDLIQTTPALVGGNPQPGESFAWQRNGAPIAATGTSYTPTITDVGSTLTVVQTATNMLGVAAKNSNAVGPVLDYSPASLFAANEPGVWYDPSDIVLGWRYNLLTRTEQFDDAGWVKHNATIAADSRRIEPIRRLAS